MVRDGKRDPSAAEVKLNEGVMLVTKQVEQWDNTRLKYKKAYGRRTDKWLADQMTHSVPGVTEVTLFLRERDEKKKAQERAESFLKPKSTYHIFDIFKLAQFLILVMIMIVLDESRTNLMID